MGTNSSIGFRLLEGLARVKLMRILQNQSLIGPFQLSDRRSVATGMLLGCKSRRFWRGTLGRWWVLVELGSAFCCGELCLESQISLGYRKARQSMDLLLWQQQLLLLLWVFPIISFLDGSKSPLWKRLCNPILQLHCIPWFYLNDNFLLMTRTVYNIREIYCNAANCANNNIKGPMHKQTRNTRHPLNDSLSLICVLLLIVTIIYLMHSTVWFWK